jgi:hypothetical protein
MISPDIMLLMLELRAAAGLTYHSQPLSQARRNAQRLILIINGFSIPALIFASLGLAIALSGKAPPLLVLLEVTVIGLVIGVQVILYRRLMRLRQISYTNLAAYQDSWQLMTEAEALAECKHRKALEWTTASFIPIVTVVAAPFGIVYAAEVLQMIRYFGVAQSWQRAMRLIIAIEITLMLIYTSVLAILPLFALHSRY